MTIQTNIKTILLLLLLVPSIFTVSATKDITPEWIETNFNEFAALSISNKNNNNHRENNDIDQQHNDDRNLFFRSRKKRQYKRQQMMKKARDAIYQAKESLFDQEVLMEFLEYANTAFLPILENLGEVFPMLPDGMPSLIDLREMLLELDITKNPYVAWETFKEMFPNFPESPYDAMESIEELVGFIEVLVDRTGDLFPLQDERPSFFAIEQIIEFLQGLELEMLPEGDDVTPRTLAVLTRLLQNIDLEQFPNFNRPTILNLLSLLQKFDLTEFLSNSKEIWTGNEEGVCYYMYSTLFFLNYGTKADMTKLTQLCPRRYSVQGECKEKEELGNICRTLGGNLDFLQRQESGEAFGCQDVCTLYLQIFCDVCEADVLP